MSLFFWEYKQVDIKYQHLYNVVFNVGRTMNITSPIAGFQGPQYLDLPVSSTKHTTAEPGQAVNMSTCSHIVNSILGDTKLQTDSVQMFNTIRQAGSLSTDTVTWINSLLGSATSKLSSTESINKYTDISNNTYATAVSVSQNQPVTEAPVNIDYQVAGQVVDSVNITESSSDSADTEHKGESESKREKETKASHYHAKNKSRISFWA